MAFFKQALGIAVLILFMRRRLRKQVSNRKVYPPASAASEQKQREQAKIILILSIKSISTHIAWAEVFFCDKMPISTLG